jgi:hypothetical protein
LAAFLAVSRNALAAFLAVSRNALAAFLAGSAFSSSPLLPSSLPRFHYRRNPGTA